MLDNFFCFAHIPKTAGTTLNTILSRLFGNQFLFLTTGLYEDFVPPEKLEARLNSGTFWRCVSGHQISADLPYNNAQFNVIGLSILRDPEERLLSDYFYHRNLGLRESAGTDESFDKFLERTDSLDENNYYFNTQAKQIKLPHDQIEVQISNRKLILIPMERFNEGLLALRRLFPIEFRDVSYTPKNVNPMRDRSLKVPKWYVERNLNADLELYDYGSSSFDALINDLYSKSELRAELARLERQCRWRAAIKSPIQRIASGIERRLSRW
jgi:hypothetical protein